MNYERYRMSVGKNIDKLLQKAVDEGRLEFLYKELLLRKIFIYSEGRGENIMYGFSWKESREGFEFWRDTNEALYRNDRNFPSKDLCKRLTLKEADYIAFGFTYDVSVEIMEVL